MFKIQDHVCDKNYKKANKTKQKGKRKPLAKPKRSKFYLPHPLAPYS